VPHHGLDVADAAEGFTAAQFKALAEQAIPDILVRGKLPIMVGGSGLYVDSVLFDYRFNALPNFGERDVLNTMSLAELLALARERGLDISGVDTANPRRVIRLIETNGARPKRSGLRSNTCVIGLKLERDQLATRVQKRVATMLKQGLENEAKLLSQRYGWDCEAMKAIGYREWQSYFAGTASLQETTAQIVTATMQLAKKQRTWFRRNNSIQWVSDPKEAVDIVTTFLNK
jgi:tRNA dimethylallyltransferase